MESLEDRRLLTTAAELLTVSEPYPPADERFAGYESLFSAEGEAGDVVRFRLEVADTSGSTITSIPSGDPFLLRGYVEDIRAFSSTGVFSAYLDVEYNASLAAAVGPISFGDEYISARNGSLATPGVVDEIGALGDIEPIGPGEFLLFSVPFQASAEGTFQFTSNIADDIPLHDVLVYGDVNPIQESEIDFGTVSLTVTPSPLRFDFGTSTSPLEPGYTRISPTSTYSGATGHGFLTGQSGPLDARDRGAGASASLVNRDLIFSNQMTFAVDLAPGEYDVIPTIGDVFPHDQMAVVIEGQTVATLSNAGGQFLKPTYRVNVTDGQLTFLLQDQGGADVNAVMNGLEIRQIPPPPGILVTPTSGLLTKEDGSQATFSVVLQTEPSADVTIGLSSSDITEGTVSPASLTFTDQNWSTPQVVTLTGVDDPDLDGPIAYTILTAPAQSSDLDYNGINPSDVTATNQDNEIPPVPTRYDFGTATSPLEAGFTRVTQATVYSGTTGFGFLTGQSGPLDSRDRGAGSPPANLTRDLVFSTQITFAVDLAVGEYDITPTIGDQFPHDQIAVLIEGQTQATLTTAANQWLTPTYRVNVNDGQLTLRLQDQGGADPNAVLNGLRIDSVTPQPGIVVTPTAGLETNESGGQASFTVVLNTQPTADVTIPLSSSDTTEGTVAPASLTFTDQDWDTPKTVTVTGADDPDVDGPIAYTILTAPSQSSDGNYNNRNAADVSVTNLDNETPPVPTLYDFGTASSPVESGYTRVTQATAYNATAGFGFLTGQSGPLASRDRGSGNAPANLTRDLVFSNQLTFAVDLPNGQYDITPTIGDQFPHDQMAVVIEGQTVQTVSTAGGQWLSPTHRVDVNDGQLTFRLQDQGGPDPNVVLNGLRIQNVTPQPSIIVTPTSGLVTNEDGGQASFTVVLNTQPTSDVTIGLSSSDTTEGTVLPTSLTFTDQDWDTPKTVTVTGVDDPDLDGAVAYTIQTAVAQGADLDYNGLNAADVSVTNQDNETPPVPTLYDFGTAGSPLQSGYTRVTPSTGYTGATGFGFLTGQSGLLDARDRGAGGPPANLTRDLVFSVQLTFAVDLPSGQYDITPTIGDQFPHDQVAVVIEGQTQATLSTAANQWLTPTYRVDVTDGQLTLRLQDQGGADPNVVLNGLQIVNVSPQPGITVTPTSGLVTDEGGGQATFTVVLNTQPTADVTIGISSSDTTEGTVAPTNLTFSDLDWDTPQTVTVTGANDPDPDGPMAYTIVTAAAQSADGGYSGLNAADVAVVNLDDDAPPAPTQYDFGTASSPIEAGYTRVTQATTYSGATGFGFLTGQSGTLDSRDRGAGQPPASLTRDLVFSTEMTFVVDVAPGNYDVILTVGDQFPHEQVGVTIEGVFQESLNNAANQFLTRTYTVTVNDGQLTVNLDDLGGPDFNAVINGLRIVAK